MPDFLYRYLDNDEDGDPIDFGILTAPDIAQATTFLEANLVDMGHAFPMKVRLYPVRASANGIWLSRGDVPGYEEIELVHCTCGRDMKKGEPHTADCDRVEGY